MELIQRKRKIANGKKYYNWLQKTKSNFLNQNFKYFIIEKYNSYLDI